jgi:hypothetical protein
MDDGFLILPLGDRWQWTAHRPGASTSAPGIATSSDAMVIVLEDAMAEVVVMAAASVVAAEGA